MHIKDEIAKRAQDLLANSGELDFGTEDQLYGFVMLGEYDIHWQGGNGLTINQRGEIHAIVLLE